jgi:predicted TIM-barrel fold metal-dependent hydrolase
MLHSADSHILEPVDLWLENMPASLRDLAPQTHKEQRRGRPQEVIYVDGKVARYEPPGLQEQTRPPNAFDPVKRLEDLDSQGIWAELLFPSVGLWCSLIETREVALEAAKAYNDWQADTFLRTSPRYIGAAMIPIVDVNDAIAEVERSLGLGYPAALLPATPPVPYNDELYEPLWALLAESGMHLCMHIGTGMDPMVTRGQGGAIINYVETLFPLQRAALHLVAAGVFDRHPDLHLVCVEGGASWLPGLIERMDEAARSHADWVKPKLSRPPSEIIRTNVHATFQNDKAILLTLDVTGVPSLLWGSDYPHLEGTWPRTQQVLDDIFGDTDDDIRARITGGTMAELFGIEVPA